ncbi:UNVERIFIED_CONTAM: putative protein S-acyltransferase 7 [Sesamum radiatum]|uniref:Uncharacterized protein n=1 Tax=Sesamum radiatum TaxID=300843 RepID=A0AAW2P819_SESRA
MYTVPPHRSDPSANASDELMIYQTWKGSNKFFLQGRFIFGPDVRSLALTIFLIVAPVAVFCVFVARKLMDDFTDHWGTSIMVIAIVFTFYSFIVLDQSGSFVLLYGGFAVLKAFLTASEIRSRLEPFYLYLGGRFPIRCSDLVLLLLTSGRDPGIIPRNAHPPEPEGYDGSVEGAQTPQLRLPRIKEVEVNGITVKISIAIPACFIDLPVALTVQYAITVLNGLTIIAPGLDSA